MMKKWIYFFCLMLVALECMPFTVLSAAVDHSKLEKGIKAYQNEQWDEALTWFQDVLLSDPENPVLHFNVGSVLYKKQKYQEALKSFDKAVQTKEVVLQQSVYYNKGNTYYQLKKYKEAIDAYKKALDLKADDHDSKYNLELVRAKLKEMADKKSQKNKSKPQSEKIDPSQYAKKLKEQAEALISQRLYGEAHALMKKGAKSDPTVKAFAPFIERLKNIVEIEGGE